MATSLQERLKLKQYQVDTWTTREQLCLASAVQRNGDQNWVAVRRNIKMLTTEDSRPPDWYSTKNCALQYAKLLERVSTPKRKRERSDSSNETPGEIVSKMLTKQRVDELATLVAEEKVAYNQQKKEIEDLEAGRLDHQLDDLWQQLLKERLEEEEEEKRHQQWLKEREEKITAIQQALKHHGPKVHIQPQKKKNKPPWPATSPGSVRRNSGMSENSSEMDSALDSPDVHEPSVDNASQEGASQEAETKPTPTSPLLSSLLSKSPILPGSSTSPLSQGRSSRPGFSPVSMALQNLVTSAISGTDCVTKSSTPSSSGSSTLSRLLDLPPSTPGAPLPRLSDLPTSSYDQKDVEKMSPFKESKDIKKCSSEDGKDSGCGSSGDGVILEVKQESASCRPSTEVVKKVEKEGEVGGGGEGEDIKKSTEVKEETKEELEKVTKDEEKSSKNDTKSLEEDNEDLKFRQGLVDSKTELDSNSRDCEEDESRTSSHLNDCDDEPLKTLIEREGKKRKEKSVEADVKEDSIVETLDKSHSSVRQTDENTSDSREDKFSYKNRLDDEENEKKVKIIKESHLYKELESQSKRMEKKDFDDYDPDKDWMNEDDGNFPRSGKRKVPGTDYLNSYSPLICESGPTSPASTHYGDDPEGERSYKSWKKPIMILWNEIAAHRFASIFLRPITDEQAPGYRSVVFRSMDLQTIKRNIESGLIRNTAEFQRDMMLMFLNATMYNTSDHNVHQMAHQMMQDTISTIEDFLNTQMLARAEETPQKSLRRETRESSAKRSDEDFKRKRDSQDEKSTKKRR